MSIQAVIYPARGDAPTGRIFEHDYPVIDLLAGAGATLDLGRMSIAEQLVYLLEFGDLACQLAEQIIADHFAGDQRCSHCLVHAGERHRTWCQADEPAAVVTP